MLNPWARLCFFNASLPKFEKGSFSTSGKPHNDNLSISPFDLGRKFRPAANLMKYRTRLMLIVFLAALLPAGLIGLKFTQERSDNVKVAMHSLEGVAKSVAVRITGSIQRTMQLHYGLARSKQLNTSDRAACSSFLAGILRDHPEYTGILTINPDGQLFCDSLQTERDLDLRNREYFKRALVSNDVGLEPVFGKLTGKAVLQIAYAVRRQTEEVDFVILASLDLDKLVQQYMAELPQTAYEIALADTKGTVLAGAPPERWSERIGKSMSDTEIFRSSNARPWGGIEEVSGFDGTPQVWAFAEIPEAPSVGMHVMAGMPRNALFSGPNNRLRKDLIILSVFFIALLAGIWSLAEPGARKPATDPAGSLGN